MTKTALKASAGLRNESLRAPPIQDPQQLLSFEQ